MSMLKGIEDVHFELDTHFLWDQGSRPVDFGPQGLITFKSKYARKSRVLGRGDQTEEWWETCARVTNGTYRIQKWHCLARGIPWDDAKAQVSAQEFYDLMFEMKWLPAGRGLSMMGTDFVIHHGGAALNNCAFISSSEPYWLQFLMEMSMLGVGVGFDTAGTGRYVHPIDFSTAVYLIHDSREGWVKVLNKVLEAALGGFSLLPVFDYSGIRPYGTPIKGFGGIASGPGPLIEMVDTLVEFFTMRQGQTLSEVDIVSLGNIVGRCVVSGNVRRSAEIALGTNSHQFITAKDYELHPDRRNFGWMSNNSVVCKPGDYYGQIARNIAAGGEPGVFWLENAQKYGRLGHDPNYRDIAAGGTNPCSEQTLESGELCNLVETFPSRCADYREYQRVLKYAYLYAKTVTLVPIHYSKTAKIVERNRRIGCSMSGVYDNFGRVGVQEHFEWCRKGYREISRRDEQYSDWFQIPRSIKTTSIKPSGTVSKLPGVSEGCHPQRAQYYWQVQRLDPQSEIGRAMIAAGYRHEVCSHEPNVEAFYIPVQTKNFYKSVEEVSMWEQLEVAAQLQANWADNQVSVTVSFNEKEADSIEQALCLYENRLKSVSFLPKVSPEQLMAQGYEHVPQQPMTEHEYLIALSNLRPLDLTGTKNEGKVDFGCEGSSCEIKGS